MTTTATKSRPIIFTGENVLKILRGEKTQTRRIAKSINSCAAMGYSRYRIYPQKDGTFGGVGCLKSCPVRCKKCRERFIHTCPHGNPGDLLWVKEAWRPWWDDEQYCVVQYRDGAIYKPGTSSITPDIPDENTGHQFADACDKAPNIPWKSPLFMPRWASRVTLEITDVRVQRLNQISNEDAEAEGCKGWYRPMHPDFGCTDGRTPAEEFAEKWDKINKSTPWAANPWVWALTFKAVTK